MVQYETYMGHLKSTRSGWENERLAEFLLSRISFIATPAKTSDDVGSDFICTLFREIQSVSDDGKRKWIELLPTSSFAIQVKTGVPRTEDVSQLIENLRVLEIPFFIGFVEQDAGKLTVYSCHHLPALFSGAGSQLSSLSMEPFDTLDRDVVFNRLNSSAANPAAPVKLPVHKVATFSVNDDEATRDSAAAAVAEQCLRTQKDIAAKISGSYVFMLDKEIYYTTAGVGSFQSFRKNLADRLMEALNNLHWVLQHGADKKVVEQEFQIYQSMYAGGTALGIPEYFVAKPALDRLSAALK